MKYYGIQLLIILRDALIKLLPCYKACKDLPFKLFVEILNHGDYRHVCKWPFIRKFLPTNSNELFATWNDIYLEFGELDNNALIADHFEANKVIKQMENAYITIKSMIRILMFTTPYTPGYEKLATNTISDLRGMGYNIDTSSTEAYSKSLNVADKRSNHYITMIRLKKLEINTNQDNDDIVDEAPKLSFEAVICGLAMATKINISKKITTLEYIEFKKIIESMNKKNA